MTTYRFYIFFLLLTTLGCQQNSDNKGGSSVDNRYEIKETAIKQEIKKESIYKTTRIVISFYDKYIPSSKDHLNYGPFSTDLIYEAKDQKLLDDFDQMIKKAIKTGYCCCPDYNYTISFYDKTNNYKDYFVDTVESKNNVRIFQASYQFSYIIDKTVWRTFLSKLKRISFNQYFITDLDTARMVYAFTKENDLL